MSATIAGEPSRTASAATEAAYEWCRTYARAHDENFSVVTWFLPKEVRPHFFSLYAFCRWTDDLGDEAEGDRLALLDAWERELRACYDGVRTSPLYVALGATIDRFDVPAEPFLRLIDANRMDQRITSFETYEELLRYCVHSAAPVGRMVLYVLGYRDEELQQLSDATCIGLQLANFWQDVGVDLAKGRIYVPREDMRRVGYDEERLRAGVVDGTFRDLMRFEVQRARDLFARGRMLESRIDRRARIDVRLFRLGGEAVLDAIERANYDVLSSRPRVGKGKKLQMAAWNGVRMRLGV